jgi:hypothetical protein
MYLPWRGSHLASCAQAAPCFQGGVYDPPADWWIVYFVLKTRDRLSTRSTSGRLSIHRRFIGRCKARSARSLLVIDSAVVILPCKTHKTRHIRQETRHTRQGKPSQARQGKQSNTRQPRKDAKDKTRHKRQDNQDKTTKTRHKRQDKTSSMKVMEGRQNAQQ